MANSIDPDQMLHSVMTDLGLQYLLRTNNYGYCGSACVIGDNYSSFIISFLFLHKNILRSMS